VAIIVWQALGIPAPVFPSPSAEFREISSASRPPRAVTAAARLSLVTTSTRLVLGGVRRQVVELPFARPLPFWAHISERRLAFGVGGAAAFWLRSPLLSPLPCLSIGAHKAGRHHHLKKAKRTAEEKRPPPHTPFTPGSIDRAARYSCCTYACLLLFCCSAAPGSGAGAFLDLLEFGSVIGKDPALAGFIWPAAARVVLVR